MSYPEVAASRHTSFDPTGMGRFSNFVANVGDIVQQANEEYRQTKQQPQQQQQQQQRTRQNEVADLRHMSAGSGLTSSQHGVSSAQQQDPRQALRPPPPLPPRQPTTSQSSHQISQQSSVTPLYNWQNAGRSHEPQVQSLRTRSPDLTWHPLRDRPKAAHPYDEAETVKVEEETIARQTPWVGLGGRLPEAEAEPRPLWQEGESSRPKAERAQEDHVDDDIVQQLQKLLFAQKTPESSSRSCPSPKHLERTSSATLAPPIPAPEFTASLMEDETRHNTSTQPAFESSKNGRKSFVGDLRPIRDCIASPVCANADWFVHEGAPAFLVCSRCFADYIHASSLRELFSHRKFDDFEKVARKCYFGSNRVKKSLWPRAAAAGKLDNMLQYMKSRPGIAECPSQTSTERQDWRVVPEIPGLAFCGACWIDDFEHGPFASQFHVDASNQPHMCGSSMPFIGRMYQLTSKGQAWEEFAAEAKGRLTIPKCPGKTPIASTAHAWVRSTRAPKGLQFCYACFADYFYGTTNAAHFQQVAIDEDTTVCLMGTPNIVIPAQQTVARDDPELFWKWIAEVDRQPFCAKQGITGSPSWYTLPNNPLGFFVCAACRAGIADPIGWSKHLVPKKNVSPKDTILCCFHPEHVRFAEFMKCLVQSMATGRWEDMGDYVANFANVPRCPRDSTATLSDRRYWGWQSLRICEECYLSFAKGTALEPLYHLHGEVIDKSRLCDLYSPRMRKMYVDACEGRAPAQGLVDTAGQRRMTFLQTMLEADRLISQQRIKGMQATMYGSMGSFYKFAGASQDSVMGHTYTLGNAYVGYGHVNGLSLTGAEYDRRGRDLSLEATGGSVWHQISILEQRWREVE